MTPKAPESEDSLWFLPAAPLVWAGHFLLCYGTAAVWCAKLVGPEGSLLPVRMAMTLYTVLGLAAVVWLGLRGYQRHRASGSTLPHDADTPQQRRAFLGFASLLLAGLSAIAIVFQALPAIWLESCR
jgi:hypothetical protein